MDDLAAVRALTPQQEQRLRGYALFDDRWGWQNVRHSDVAAVMALLDAQAARLAAIEQAVNTHPWHVSCCPGLIGALDAATCASLDRWSDLTQPSEGDSDAR